MPLLFNSLSHGAVSFGFYNIETDGLLLGEHFFFCTDFCSAMIELFEKPLEQDANSTFPGHVFDDPQRIGNLKGAMTNSSRHTSYFGELYRMWPFSEAPGAFRQKLHCFKNRERTLALLESMSTPVELQVTREPYFQQVAIGSYHFSGRELVRLLQYVVRGGYPTWEDHEESQLPDPLRALCQHLAQHEESLMGGRVRQDNPASRFV
jgi:hypothetical protein